MKLWQLMDNIKKTNEVNEKFHLPTLAFTIDSDDFKITSCNYQYAKSKMSRHLNEDQLRAIANYDMFWFFGNYEYLIEYMHTEHYAYGQAGFISLTITIKADGK